MSLKATAAMTSGTIGYTLLSPQDDT